MNPPTHQEIAQHARRLWQDRGCPTGCDTELWLEAEQQLQNHPPAEAAPAAAADTFAKRAQEVTASENLIGYQLPPAPTEQDAIQAALQKREARAPQTAHHTGPKPKPSETGKPVWSKPHSS